MLLRRLYLQYFLRRKYQNAVVLRPAEITNVHNLVIKGRVYIGPSAWLALFGKLTIEDGTIIGPRVKIHTANHNYNGKAVPYDKDFIIKDVYIGRNVWIGADVTILPGVSLGEGCIVAAGAVVTKDVSPMHIVGGNPAKFLKKRDEELYWNNVKNDNIYLGLKGF